MLIKCTHVRWIALANSIEIKLISLCKTVTKWRVYSATAKYEKRPYKLFEAVWSKRTKVSNNKKKVTGISISWTPRTDIWLNDTTDSILIMAIKIFAALLLYTVARMALFNWITHPGLDRIRNWMVGKERHTEMRKIYIYIHTYVRIHTLTLTYWNVFFFFFLFFCFSFILFFYFW